MTDKLPSSPYLFELFQDGLRPGCESQRCERLHHTASLHRKDFTLLQTQVDAPVAIRRYSVRMIHKDMWLRCECDGAVTLLASAWKQQSAQSWSVTAGWDGHAWGGRGQGPEGRGQGAGGRSRGQGPVHTPPHHAYLQKAHYTTKTKRSLAVMF